MIESTGKTKCSFWFKMSLTQLPTTLKSCEAGKGMTLVGNGLGEE